MVKMNIVDINSPYRMKNLKAIMQIMIMDNTSISNPYKMP